MDGRLSDDRALDFSAVIGLIAVPRHMLFIHGRILSLENCRFTPSIFQVVTKRLAMDAHRMTLKDGSPPGS